MTKPFLPATMRRIDVAPGIFTVDTLLEPSECQALIRTAEASGFDAAPIVSPAGARIDTNTRNNDRHVFDDEALSLDLWLRLQPFTPAMLNDRRPIGLNERFRIYRYVPGQKFAWHADAPFHRPSGELSLLTFMVYLNSGYEGGATRFEAASVVGTTGLALIFQHGLVHEGSAVLNGTKYALRSDVMYGPPEHLHPFARCPAS
jgi:prolyl 4-hydroxylase